LNYRYSIQIQIQFKLRAKLNISSKFNSKNVFLIINSTPKRNVLHWRCARQRFRTEMSKQTTLSFAPSPPPPVEEEEEEEEGELLEEHQYEDELEGEDEVAVVDGDEEFQDGTELQHSQYGPNTPNKNKRSTTAAPKGSWVTIKRLRNHPALPSMTHVCTRKGCWRLIHMSRDKKSKCWLTTNAIKHDKKFHLEDSKPAALSVTREDNAGLKKQTIMFGSQLGGSESTFKYAVSKNDCALAAQARGYVYARGHVSKESFDDPMVRATGLLV
jgi:hypothetical protein